MQGKITCAILLLVLFYVSPSVAAPKRLGNIPDKAKIKKLEKIDQKIGGIKKHLSVGEINKITNIDEANEWRKDQAILVRFLLSEFKKGLK